jgi:hypothetical protein
MTLTRSFKEFLGLPRGRGRELAKTVILKFAHVRARRPRRADAAALASAYADLLAAADRHGCGPSPRHVDLRARATARHFRRRARHDSVRSTGDRYSSPPIRRSLTYPRSLTSFPTTGELQRSFKTRRSTLRSLTESSNMRVSDEIRTRASRFGGAVACVATVHLHVSGPRETPHFGRVPPWAWLLPPLSEPCSVWPLAILRCSQRSPSARWIRSAALACSASPARSAT